MRSLFRWYGLVPGERLSITENLKLPGEGYKKKGNLFQERQPDSIVVVREYPYLIRLRGTWRGLHEYSYDFCIEKASVYSGEVEVRRLSSGKKLKALELQSDYERNKGKET